MTGCLYMSPPFQPSEPNGPVFGVLLADTIATGRLVSPNAVDLRPATSARFQGKFESKTSMVRKLNIVGSSAIAMAGEANWIRQCLYELKIKMPELEDSDRPMRWLGDAANRVNAKLNRNAISVLGIAAIKGKSTFNCMSYLPPEIYSNLGQCAAIGSGSEDLYAFCKEGNETFYEQQIHGQPIITSTLHLSASINATQLHKELNGAGRAHWGGYIEGAYYNTLLGTWVRFPPSINLFYLAKLTNSGKVHFLMSNQMFAYDPGGDVGRVLTMTSGQDGIVHEFILPNIMDEDISELMTGGKFWFGWRPKVATLSFAIPKGMGNIPEGPGRRIVNITVSTEDVERHLIFQLDSYQKSWGLTAEFHSRICSSICAAIGCDFEPVDTGAVS